MKKLLSVLTAIVLVVVSVMTVLGSAVTVSAETVSGAAWLYKFNTPSKIDGKVTAPLATFSYDSEENAMKLNAKEDGVANSTLWQLNTPSSVSVSVADYKYLAIRVKVASENRSEYQFRMTPIGATVNSWANQGYADTDEWQTLYFDIQSYNDTAIEYNTNPAVYSKIEVVMAYYRGATVNADDTFYIAWVGGFASIEDINAYSNKVSGAAWKYSFDDTSKIDGHINDCSANISYSEEHNALKVVPTTDGVHNSTYWSMYTPVQNISVTDYKYIAIRIKAESSNVSKFRLRLQPASATNRGGSWNGVPYNADTSEWQTVYCDISELYTFDDPAVYSKLEVYLADWKSGATADTTDTFYVAWIGGFASVEDIYSETQGSNVIRFDSPRKATSASVTNNKAYTTVFDNVQMYTYDSVDAYSYSSDENALFIEPKSTTGDHNLFIDIKGRNISAEKYPVIAYKAKWSQTAMETFAAAGKTSVASHITAATDNNTYTNSNGGSAYGPEHNGTGLSGVKADWQIAYADFTSNVNEGIYTNITLDVIGYRTYQTQEIPENLPLYIEWVGLFETLEDAYAYDAECAIDAIDFSITTDSADEIASADALYTALSDNNKAKVYNKAELDDAKAVFSVVEQADEANKIDSITVEVNENLKAIWAERNTLSHANRNRIGNIAVLEKLMDIGGVVEAIALLPDVITYKNASTFANVENACADFSETEMSKISNYNDYLAAKEDYAVIAAADKGDLNIDGDVDILDFIRFKKSMAGQEVTIFANPNLNGDEEIDTNDVIELIKILIGA